jgi:hypothetical protein
MGARAADLVPLAAYTSAAAQLTGPSSLARAIASGACHQLWLREGTTRVVTKPHCPDTLTASDFS